MKIILCGAGTIGSSLIHYLSFDCPIIVIDHDPVVLSTIKATYDVRTICGNAADPVVLAQANPDAQTHVIGATNCAEVNLMACHLCHILGSVASTMARVESTSYLHGAFKKSAWEHFHVNMVFSRHDFLAKAIINALDHPAAFDTCTLAEGSLTLLGIHIGLEHPWRGKTIKALEECHPFGLSIIRLMRRNAVWVPKALESLEAHDSLYLVLDSAYINDFYVLWHWNQSPPKSILFLGSSPTALSVLPELLLKDYAISLVSENQNDLLAVAQAFPSVQLIQESCTSPTLINELVGTQELCAIACGPKDHENILAAALTAVSGVRQTMACIDDLEYIRSGCILGIGTMIHCAPKILTAILQKMTKNKQGAIYPLQGVFSGCVIEASVYPGAKITKMSCTDWQEERWRIVALWRNETCLWSPETIIPGDRVIITALWDQYHVVQTHLAQDRF